MIQSFRNKLQGIFAFVLVFLISIPFVLFGVDSLFSTGSTQGQVAEVDGVAITEIELSRALEIQKQQMRTRFGEQLPEEFLSDERLREPVLQQLIQQNTEIKEAYDNRLAASDQVIDRILLDQVAFQLDGQFSAEMYRQRLRTLGYNPTSYKKVLHEELVANQQRNGITLSSFATPSTVESTLLQAGQTRDFYYVTFAKDKYAEGVDVDAEAVEAQYQDNQAQYMGAEKVKVQSIVLDTAALAAPGDVAEEDIRSQYEQNISVFKGVERRSAAHILVEDSGDGVDQIKVDKIAARLKAGDSYESVAKELSDDILSAETGGGIGFTDGATFPDAFEAKLAQMKEGDVSEAVITEAGVHFIKLLEIDAPKPPSYEVSRTEVLADIVKSLALERFEDLVIKLEELSYDTDDLSVVADELGVDVAQSDWFDRNGAAGVLASAKVLAEVFSDEVLKERQTSPLIELSDEKVMVVRVNDYSAPAVKPLAEVAGSIKQSLTDAAILKKQTAASTEVVTKLKSGEDIELVAKAESLPWEVVITSRRDNFKVERDLLDKAFTMAAATLPADDTLIKPNGDMVLIQLNKVVELSAAEINEAERQQAIKQITGQNSQQDYLVFQQQLKDQAEVIIR